MLKQRVITAVILVAVLLAAIFFLPLTYFAILIAAVVLMAAWEWAQFLYFQGLSRIVYVLLTTLLLLLVSWWVQFIPSGNIAMPIGVMVLCGVAALWWLLAVFFVAVYPRQKLWAHKPIQACVGFVILISTWLGLVFLRSEPKGEWLIIISIMAVICADTGAFFIGRRFGKRKLAPSVSPGKSWEGFFGGFFCSVIFSLFLASAIGPLWDNMWLVAIVVVTSLASVYGDLLESMLKRERGIKDSGTILPGHGGVLDRADSITAAIPVFTLMYLVSGWHL